MKLVTSEQMRALDQRTIEEFGTPGALLMERAGQGVALVVAQLGELTGRLGCVRCVAGRGNNGGDVFVAARCLHEMGWPVELALAGEAGELRGDARLHFERMLEAGVEPVTFDQIGGLPPRDIEATRELVVEGILGTGISGAPRGDAEAAIRRVNQLGAQRPVVAVDVPSGLNSDSGAAAGAVVRADVTVTIGLPKTGLVASQARELVGTVEVIDIGIPVDYTAGLPADTGLITADDLRPLFPRRARVSHKGTYGHVLLIGGSREYSGAISMAAMSAVRSGAGLVTVLTPAATAACVTALVPEAMVYPAPACDDGALTATAMQAWSHPLSDFDAVMIGPGLTRTEGAQRLAQSVLTSCPVPLVVDADALPDAAQIDILKQAAGPLVLTPHPGEMARLRGCDVATVQSNRRQTARDVAAQTGATVILKGCGTVVAQPDGTAFINATGNPGMACGGMGDVLAGLLTGLLAQGLPPFEAAQAAVYLHGRAADRAAWQGAQASLKASDVVEALPPAFRELSVS
ncbi:MAG: NAD(P)H-hydrate dehydratase [Verrucomicrobia bacterium]|jgi:ADP-dependent NAD(P)H-hydrate dehydratase / NAD(P)H-hydrate epimerase|nr:NAD(P)H-hydrate dehydratase [Verrucomicrobiota bacterium]MBT7066977.1 NAD(P)H-hydrate dehydratase [Verrucomicrobiota bacterium]MBT7699992.1 NAD(P)H-hydrate dehydratase [Verrucomicrobiota bacterium]